MTVVLILTLYYLVVTKGHTYVNKLQVYLSTNDLFYHQALKG